jgi:hypothetical protein
MRGERRGPIHYGVFDEGFEVDSGFYDTEDSVRDFMKSLKRRVDEYRDYIEGVFNE